MTIMNTEKYKKMIIISIIIAITSQINMNLLISDFRVSVAIILFPVFLYLFDEIDTIKTGVMCAISVYILRVGIYFIENGSFIEILLAYFPEIFFYTFYSIFFKILNKKNSIKFNRLLITLILSDYLGNFVEILIRNLRNFNTLKFQIVTTLFYVAVIRSIISLIIVNSLKFYKLLLIKEEHEQRYKKLVLQTSELKTEMYWMKKNMSSIEKIMSNAYGLFEKISIKEDSDTWAQLSLTIAKDVHEIKKEYGLVVRGIEEITEDKSQDKGMYFKDIINILEDSMKNEVKFRQLNVGLIFNVNKNFYTTKHYYLMSIFRNLIMNSLDALSAKTDKVYISFIQKAIDERYIFIISDTGCGIKESDLMYIFSPGFSTKINYDTGEINRGLGLSIVKNIVEEDLKGNINVDSIEDSGATFCVTINKSELEDV
ncbi:ATP-binding protein [Clostridium bowmanii]|uniref:ATP-binding protein n=1 Tax=Clostridium bowmanii TaxID=132925 RepID=UPI001C0D16F2|nr:ATP-binding protein [Clostridium bowmanii]MBU3191414.1 ATP-binding protein [Clostridium bowmanii]MCA1075592.1 ATP-binding protein [Clostridium bowmanii]